MTFSPAYDPVIYELARIQLEEAFLYDPTRQDWWDYEEHLADLADEGYEALEEYHHIDY
ncbi:MAG: hypothetical protein HC818_00045 [Synechococcaceae cyanobacterium RM1_1_27]|nr:hypothetical protein [Synechococcaceae cyanobacterium RM1_1_27]